jgi:uncharacterized protein YcbK (DUF882 family)
VNRRQFLALGAGTALAGLLPRTAAAGAFAPLPPRRSLCFFNTHTEERLATTYWERGAYLPDSLAAIDGIMRDHRTGQVHPMHPRLLDLLYAIRDLLGTTRPFHVISGFRSPETNRLLHRLDPSGVSGRSLHLVGQAVDIRVLDRPLVRVRDAALALGAGGVGYYPQSSFVHVDIGKVRAW